jgi:uncharacterized protein
MSEMTVDELRASGRIIYDVVSGSHAYGTNIPTSDSDLRGYFYTSKDSYISLFDVQDQVNDKKNDVVYYDLKRAFDLLKTANPNQIELLWIPDDCIRSKHDPIMNVMLENRKLFISKKAYFTHAEYSLAQIKKAKGANKKVHNPMSKEMPRKEDFCWFISTDDENNRYDGSKSWFDKLRNFCYLFLDPLVWNLSWLYKSKLDKDFPFRPKPLRNTNIDLSKYHVSSMEHTPNVFRLYWYGEEAKGVFRGDQYLACESIPKEDEIDRFKGILIYNHPEFERAVKDWHSYWDWMKNRNESRWIDQEKGLLSYDQKNMMHCVRLLMSSENILVNCEPLVRVSGEDKEHLMKIRRGEFTYEEIMRDVEEREIKLKKLYETSSIPEDVDMDKLNMLFKKLMDIGEESMKGKI